MWSEVYWSEWNQATRPPNDFVETAPAEMIEMLRAQNWVLAVFEEPEIYQHYGSVLQQGLLDVRSR